MFHTVITDDRFGNSDLERQVLKTVDAELRVLNLSEEEGKNPETLPKELLDAEGVLVNLFPLTGEIIRKLKRCKVISRYGVGYDNVDVAAAEEMGIAVTRVPGYCNEDVSDHALALLLSLVRAVPYKDRKVRGGHWNTTAPFPVRRLKGKTLGLIGYGEIAKVLHRKVKGFGLGRILVYDPYAEEETVRTSGALYCDLDTLLEGSDFVSLHAPATEETKGLINRETLSKMKPGAFIINTSRGSLVKEDDLAEALKQGMIGGAGLDVFESEPLAQDSPLRELDNAVITDHCAYYSEESVEELKKRTAENVAEVLRGDPPSFPVSSGLQT